MFKPDKYNGSEIIKGALVCTLFIFAYRVNAQTLKKLTVTYFYLDNPWSDTKFKSYPVKYIEYNNKGQEVRLFAYGNLSSDNPIAELTWPPYSSDSDTIHDITVWQVVYKNYDKQGRVVKLYCRPYQKDEKYNFLGAVTYTYYDSGLLKEQVSYHMDDSIKPYKTLFFEYNKTGLIYHTIDISRSVKTERTFLYDRQNNNTVIADSCFDPENGKLHWSQKIEKSFDGLNRLTDVIINGNNGETSFRDKFKYRDKNNQVSLRKYRGYKDSIPYAFYETTVHTVGKMKVQPKLNPGPYTFSSTPQPWPLSENVSDLAIEGADWHQKFIYNKRGLLIRIEYYYYDALSSYIRYDYEYR